MASIHDKQSDVILEGSERPNSVYTRADVVSRGFSPIVGDPTMLPPQESDPLSREEIEHLNSIHIRMDDKALGAGQHAIIYSGSFQDRATQQTVHCAIKRSFSYRQAWAEWEALNLFGHQKPHKNIIFYYGFYRSEMRMYLFIELSKIGDLSHYLSTEYGSKDITEYEMYHLFRHIRKGLEYMHDNGYAHRDIKIHNVLVFHRDQTSPGKDSAKVVCKLCDFGSTRRYNSGDMSRTVIGSPKTMAPEVCDTPYNAFMTDVYSLGVILYQLSHDGNYPVELSESHSHTNAPQVVEKYARQKRNPQSIKWSHRLSQPLRELLMKMLEPEPNRRIHLKALLESSWMSQNKSGGSQKHHQHSQESSGSQTHHESSGSQKHHESSGSQQKHHQQQHTQEKAPSEGGADNSPKEEIKLESGSESGSRHAESKGGRYRSHRSERSESNTGNTVQRTDSKPSQLRTHSHPKLDRNPYASGKDSKRYSPSSFFEK